MFGDGAVCSRQNLSRFSKICIGVAVFLTILNLAVNEGARLYSRYYFPDLMELESTLRQQMARRRKAIHPFENLCRFPILEQLEPDVANMWHAVQLRTMRCNYTEEEIVKMDSEGYIYILPRMNNDGSIIDEPTCFVTFLLGGLRPTAHIWDESDPVVLPQHRRLFVNSDAFVVQCKDANGTIVFEKPFASVRDPSILKNTVLYAENTNLLDVYGRRKKVQKPKPRRKKRKRRLSVNILAFDSTSRTQFLRHMPRTSDLMKEMGFLTLYGYNKVGDNSAVNLVPLFAGDLPEAMAMPRLNEYGEINEEWILPTHMDLDPDLIPFIWNEMSRQGCATMFNDDVMHTTRGLFHYPFGEFQRGFKYQPTTHYYRAYYNYLYHKQRNEPLVCVNDRIVQEEFVDLWRQFALRYKDACHFGFTFIASLTHDIPYFLELMDEKVALMMQEMLVKEAIDDTVLIIMGDHGQRISSIQYTYTGRFEERMPLFAIRMPPWFQEEYPDEYANLERNQWAFTSNFDLHQFLVDIVGMRFGEERKNTTSTGRGTSLFEEIPLIRSCNDTSVANNFCTCLLDRSNVTAPIEDYNETLADHIETSVKTLKMWLKSQGLEKCVSIQSTRMEGKMEFLGPHPYVRNGVRSTTDRNKTKIADTGPAKLDFLYFEFTSVSKAMTGGEIFLRVRIKEDVMFKSYNMNFEPFVIFNPNPACSEHKYLPSLCECLARPAIVPV